MIQSWWTISRSSKRRRSPSQLTCISAIAIRLFVQSPLNIRLRARKHLCGNNVPVALPPSIWPKTTVRNCEAAEGILPLSQPSHKHVGRLAKRRTQDRTQLFPNFERDRVASSVASLTLLVVTPRVTMIAILLHWLAAFQNCICIAPLPLYT
jgi:hypothetical protein